MGDIKKSQNLPIQPLPQRGQESRTERSRSVSEAPPPQTESQDGKESRFKAGLLNRSESTGSLPTQSEERSLELGMETKPGPKLQERSSFVPTPGSLMQAKQELKPVETVEKSGLGFARSVAVQDTQTLSVRGREQHEVQPLSPPMSDQDLIEGLKNLRGQNEHHPIRESDRTYMQVRLRTERELPDELTNAFSEVWNRYEQRTTLTGSRTSVSGGEAVPVAARDWAMGLGSDSDLGMVLAGKSEGELRDLVSRMLKDIKGYDDHDMSKLSARKRDFIDKVVEGLREGIAQAQPGAPGEMAAATARLSRAMRDEIGGLPEGSPLRRELSLRDDDSLRKALSGSFGVKQAPVSQALFEGVMQGLGEHGRVSVETVETPNRPGLQVPGHITLNGKTYHQPKFLGEGGFAKVIRYQNSEDPTDFVAVKQINPGTGQEQLEIFQAAAGEVRAQQELEGPGGHRNLTHLEGVIRVPGNQLYIVQEFLGGGDLLGVNQKLWALRGQGLDEETHRLLGLYLAQGMLEGLDQIQNERQGHHFDLKLPNIMLSSEGEVKITDFGFSGLGREREVGRLQGNDNPDYKSPELIAQIDETQRAPINRALQDRGIRTFNPMPRLDRLQPPEPPQDPTPEALTAYRALESDYNAKRLYVHAYDQELKARNQLSVGSGSDTWNAGVAVYQLLKGELSGHQLWSSDFLTVKEGNLTEFGQNPNNRVQGAGKLEDGSTGLGAGALDKLINSLMMPGSEERVNLRAALGSSLFQDERLQQPEMRQLLMLIARTDLEQPPEDFRRQLETLQNSLK